MVVSDRPGEARDRAVPGHGEGDLIIGRDLKSAVGTRYVLLLHLRGGRDAHLVQEAMRKAITALPVELARTVTWDQGGEWPITPISPSRPESRCTSATRTSRGSEDRTRTPRGCCDSTYPRAPTSPFTRPEDLARIAASLNNRPCKTLGFMTPSEKLTELVAHTA
jgi:IS30 family transposase